MTRVGASAEGNNSARGGEHARQRRVWGALMTTWHHDDCLALASAQPKDRLRYASTSIDRRTRLDVPRMRCDRQGQ